MRRHRCCVPIASVALRKVCIPIGFAIAICTWAFSSTYMEPVQQWQADVALGYQHGLLQLLQTKPIPQASPYMPRLQYYAATVDRTALRHYMVQHGMQLPTPNQYHNRKHTCHSIATSVSEPFHPSMLVRNRTVRMQLPGGAPLALWRWDSGRITRQHWESVPSSLWEPSGQDCAHCGGIMKFKVLGGRVYNWKRNPDIWQRGVVQEMLQVVVHLYNIPDVDLLVHYADGASAGHPVLGVNVNMSHPEAGFTIPYMDHWMYSAHALSLQQAVVWADCLRARYPRNTAIPRAVWRGSTTDPKLSAVTRDDFPRQARYKLHQLSIAHWDVLDAHLTKVIQTIDSYPGNCEARPDIRLCNQTRQHIAALLGLPNPEGKDGPYLLSPEQYQRYAVLLDIDGNSWSSRFFQAAQHTQAPILKQASPLQTWYEHLFAPGGPLAIEHFAPDLHDIVPRAVKLLDSLGCDREGYAAHHGPKSDLSSSSEVTCTGTLHTQQPAAARRLIERQQQIESVGNRLAWLGMRQGGWEQAVQATNDVAAVLLNRWSMVESVAYVITKYASLCDWKPQLEPDYYELITHFKDTATQWLPPQLVKAIDRAAREDSQAHTAATQNGTS